MTLSIDHIVICVNDVNAAIETYRGLGFNAFYGGKHASGQTHNGLIVFDDGSYDDCHIKSMQVRRMDDGVPCGYNPNHFADSVGFCCNDIGEIIQVLFAVTDFEGVEAEREAA